MNDDGTLKSMSPHHGQYSLFLNPIASASPSSSIFVAVFGDFQSRPEMDSAAVPMPTKKAEAHTSFWVGTNVMVLFPGWPGNYSLLDYYLALLLVFVLSFLSTTPRMIRVTSARCFPMFLLLHAFKHGLEKCLFYLVVLCVVTFNVGVFLAAMAGHAVGYFMYSAYYHYRRRARIDTKV